MWAGIAGVFTSDSCVMEDLTDPRFQIPRILVHLLKKLRVNSGTVKISMWSMTPW